MTDSPAEKIIQLATGYMAARCVTVLADFGVPDALGDAPTSTADLARAVGVDAPSLDRVLKALASYGIFSIDADGRVAHTDASRLLRSDHPKSMRLWSRFCGLPVFYDALSELEHSIRSGRCALNDKVFPEGEYAYLAAHPDESQIFNEMMTAKTKGILDAVLRAYDFSQFGTVADLGGNQGQFIRGILKACPQVRGILFDLPNVVAGAPAADRLEIRGGSWFDDPLPSSDAYCIMEALHNWSDEDVTRIFAAIKRAAPANAKILVIEPLFAPGIDIHMLAVCGGRCRTAPEWKAVLELCGLTLDRVIETGTRLAIVEASIPAG